MPKTREINVYQIASTHATNELDRWIHEEFDHELPLGSVSTQAGMLIGCAGKRCYLSFKAGLNPNVTKIREDWCEYLDNILASGHGSVLEHASYTYAIEGVTRVFTGELNRHRAGVAISEGSMRYIRFDEITFWMPLSLRDDIELDPRERKKREASRAVFINAFHAAEKAYKELEEIWHEELEPTSTFSGKKKLTSMFRRIVPMGCCTGGVWTFNLRALRHVIALRSTPHAEEEIALVMGMIAKDIFSKEPQLFGDFIQTAAGFWVPKYNKI